MAEAEIQPWMYFSRPGHGVWQATRPVQDFGGVVGRVVFAAPVMAYELDADGNFLRSQIGESEPIPLSQVGAIYCDPREIWTAVERRNVKRVFDDAGA